MNADPAGTGPGARFGLGAHARGVQHVGLVVDDMDAAFHFYEQGLGLTRAARPDFPFPGAWYTVGAQQVHIFDGPAPGAGRHHLAIEVDDLDAVVADLATRGVTAKVQPHVPGAGRQAVLRDPAGNRIELNQPDR